MTPPRFIHSGGDILLDGARLSLVEAEDIRLIFEDEISAAANTGDRVAVAHAVARTKDLETAMEAARQWHAAARGMSR